MTLWDAVGIAALIIISPIALICGILSVAMISAAIGLFFEWVVSQLTGKRHNLETETPMYRMKKKK